MRCIYFIIIIYSWPYLINESFAQRKNISDRLTVVKNDVRKERQWIQIIKTLCKKIVCVPESNLTSSPIIPPPSKIKSNTSELTNDTHCMKFEITPPKHTIENLKVSLHVYIKRKRKGKRRRNKTIEIAVYELDPVTKQRTEIAKLKRKIKKPKFYSISLPMSLSHRLLDNSQPELHLCLECTKCNKKTSITYPVRKRKRNKKKHKRPRASRKSRNIPLKNLKLTKKRPYLQFAQLVPKRRRNRRFLTRPLLDPYVQRKIFIRPEECKKVCRKS